MISRKIVLILVTITIIGAVLRFFDLTKIPSSLNIDEVSSGYNAYSILKTDRDEYGNFLPLSFRSLDDYKPPLFIYSLVPSIAAFGLNEFAVRFPSALLGTLSIPFFYAFFIQIVKIRKYALIATLLLAISPWHIFVSRLGWDYMLGLLLTVTGIFCLLKIQSSRYSSIGAAILLSAALYAQQSPRLFIPLFIIFFFISNRKNLLPKKENLLLFLTPFIILIIPFILSFIFGPDRTRAQMTFITKDVEFVRNVIITPLGGQSPTSKLDILIYPFSLTFHFLRKLTAYFQPSFLFFSGLNLTAAGTFGLGVMYIFELPFFIWGFLALLTKKIANKRLILIWLLLGLLPASLTQNEQHYGRSLLTLPMVVVISAIGVVTLFQLISQKLTPRFRFIILSLFTIGITWNLVYAYLIYTIHFPNQRGEDFMEGTKETVLYALMQKDKYQEIVFDPVRGVQGPYIVNVPHAYILFYSEYDPSKYQKEAKRAEDGSFKFDKFTIRPIDWRTDRHKEDTLFIGSPWSLPQKDIKKEDILKRIYLRNGNLAFLIVSPE